MLATHQLRQGDPVLIAPPPPPRDRSAAAGRGAGSRRTVHHGHIGAPLGAGQRTAGPSGAGGGLLAGHRSGQQRRLPELHRRRRVPSAALVEPGRLAARAAGRPCGAVVLAAGRPTVVASQVRSARTGTRDEPVMHVCFYEAEAYARWAGKRLPTESGWEKAARHDPVTRLARQYPWGDDDATADRANLGQDHLQPAPVGAYPAGASPLGIQQLIGDVWEWTSSDFAPYPGFMPGRTGSTRRCSSGPTTRCCAVARSPPTGWPAAGPSATGTTRSAGRSSPASGAPATPPRGGLSVCRHLAYVGEPLLLAALLTEPPHSLVRQSWAPRRQQHGVVNADGFGIGWYVDGLAEPARHRGSRPIWADETFADLARVIRTTARCWPRCGRRPSGWPTGRPRPHRSDPGPWLFSHNGAVDGWPAVAVRLAWGLDPAGAGAAGGADRLRVALGDDPRPARPRQTARGGARRGASPDRRGRRWPADHAAHRRARASPPPPGAPACAGADCPAVSSSPPSPTTTTRPGSTSRTVRCSSPSRAGVGVDPLPPTPLDANLET